MDARFSWRPDPRRQAPAVVVVDVLSWTTTVTVAAARGAAIIPSAEPTPDRHWLSPAAMQHAALPDPPTVTISSPNGSALAAEIPSAITVVAGCLRNASAVARWLLAADYDAVEVIAAGEHWTSHRWRRCAEDYLGAGAILAALGADDRAARAWRTHGHRAAHHLHRSLSGRELSARGYGPDVTLAGGVDADDTVPVRIDGAFRAAPLRAITLAGRTDRRPPPAGVR